MRRYSQRGGYDNYGGTQYGQPNIKQYESFFNPVTIEFVQQQLDKRQDRYDGTPLNGCIFKTELFHHQSIHRVCNGIEVSSRHGRFCHGRQQ